MTDKHEWRDNAQFDTKTLFGFFIESVVDDMGNPPSKGSEALIFTGECGRKFKLYHNQDCCECVSIDDIVGDVSDLCGAMIYHAEEVDSADEHAVRLSRPAPSEDNDDQCYGYPESETWTFYKLRTSKGWVEFKWYGSSNGYYSERVDFAVYVRGEHGTDVTVPAEYEDRYWEWQDK